MLLKTPALVLHRFPYGERSIIVRMYTREAGLQSYFIPSVRSKKTPLSPALMLPLQELELVACHYEQEKRLGRLKEARCINRIEQAHAHPVTTSIAQFIAEVLLRIGKDQEPHPGLYEFTRQCIEHLHGPIQELGNLPLYFTLKLTEFLGFYPSALTGGKILDLRAGVFLSEKPDHPDFADERTGQSLMSLLSLGWTEAKDQPLNSGERLAALKTLESYFRIHLDDFVVFKSLDVLHTVLS